MKLHTVRLELRPGRPDAWPMRAMPDWDQLRGFVPPFEHLDVDRERLTVCVDLLPVAPRELVSLRHRILAAVRRREMRDSLVTIGGASDWVMPAENIERQVERQGLMAKVGRSDPFFRVQVLISATSPSRERARELVERTYAAWEQFSGQNYMRAVGLPVLGLWFLGSNAPWRRSWFDLRSRTGLHAGRGLLTARELAGFLKPWTRHCPEPIVARRERELPPPPEVAASAGMVICEVEGRPYALADEDARFHVQVVAPTGKGKTTLLANLVLARIERRLASVVIDPGLKGDIVRRDLLPRVPERDWDRVVLLDPALGRERPLGLNVLENAGPEQHELIADQVTYVFRSLFQNSWGARMDDVMHTSLLTLLRRPGSTLCDLPQLLLDDGARRRWTRDLGDPLGLDMFWREWSKLSESERNQRCGPILARLRTVLMRPSVRNLLGQSRSTIDLGRILDQGGVLLVSLPAGEIGPQTSSLLGALLIARIWQVVQARSSRPEHERPDALVVVDEAHRVVRLPQLEEIPVEARSLHVGLLLAHQHMGQLRQAPDLKAALGANVHTRIAFQAEQDADELAPWMRPVGAADLAGLRRFEVAVRLCVGGHSQPAFIGMTRPPAPELGPDHAARLVAAALERWGRPRAEVEAEMLERYRGEQASPEEDEWA
jgi:TraM recognition site of TraD and TraG